MIVILKKREEKGTVERGKRRGAGYRAGVKRNRRGGRKR